MVIPSLSVCLDLVHRAALLSSLSWISEGGLTFRAEMAWKGCWLVTGSPEEWGGWQQRAGGKEVGGPDPSFSLGAREPLGSPYLVLPWSTSSLRGPRGGSLLTW